MPPRVIPPEIRDTIVDQFSIKGFDGPRQHWPPQAQGNYKVLQTLLSVSKEVAVRARHHLFETVDLSLITLSDCEATSKDEKQLSLMADIIALSVASQDLGILPHIRRLFIFCHRPAYCYHSDGNDHDEEEPDSIEIQPGEDERIPSTESGSHAHTQLCQILDVIKQQPRRIDEFHVAPNHKFWGSTPSTFDALQYENWELQMPKNVKKAILDFIHSPHLRIKTFSLNQFCNVPHNLLLGSEVEGASLHVLPSTSGSIAGDFCNLDSEVNDTLRASPMRQLQSLDYILGDVTKLLCSQSATSNLSVKDLSLDVPLSWIYYDVDEKRFERLGQVIMEFYRTIQSLKLIFQGIYVEEVEGNLVFDTTIWPMIIDIRKLPNLTHLFIQHNYAYGAFIEKVDMSNHNTSGPAIRNLIAILTYCPDTLISVHWEVGFPFNRVMTKDMKLKLGDEYAELDDMLTTKFPRLRDFTIWFSLDPKHHIIETRCHFWLRRAFPRLGSRLRCHLRSS